MRYNGSMAEKTVLIVEDSLELADTLRDMLTMHEYRALVAVTGKDGVSLALTHHPDLVMLDLRLPDISGYDVFQAIRADSWGAHAKITILTASESLENISKNTHLPIECILFKPDSSIPFLLEHIEKRLKE
jgi:DNA-binding response OmpR family regulator